MNKFIALAALLVSGFVVSPASAAWVSSAKVTRVVVDDSGSFDIWFNVDVADSSCTNKSRITVDSASVTSAEARDRILQLVLAAKLSSATVEVSTKGSCVGSNGKYDFVGLKG